jgi:putative SOS response-associated peptidase YedK
MVMAGLWEEWTSPANERIKSCTVITCEPNEIIGTLHDRMPVVLEEKDWPKWLGEEEATEAELKALLVPCASDRLKLWPVHKRVGNVATTDANWSSRLWLSRRCRSDWVSRYLKWP